MKFTYLSRFSYVWLTAFVFSLTSLIPSFGQIELSLRYLESDNKYHVYLRPTANPTGTNAFLTDGSSQITITAGTGNTAISNITSVNPTAAWSLMTTTRNQGDLASGAPAATDFFVFSPGGDFSSITYTSGTEVELFNFSITGDCAGAGAAYDILPSGSQTAEGGTLNIGSYYSVAGYAGGLGTSHFSATYNMVALCDIDGDGVPNHNDNCPLIAGFPISGCPTVALTPKAFLQGASTLLTQPYTLIGDGLMRDVLRTNNIIPTTQPYTALGFTSVNVTGPIADPATVFAVTGADAIVDWVLVELRDAATPATVVTRQAGLIQRDGDIVDIDGISPLQIAVEAGNYIVAIRHRNHLGIANAATTTLNHINQAINLTTSTLFGTNPAAEIGGVNYMWAGNANGDTSVIAAGANSDRSTITNAVTTATGNTNALTTFILQGYALTDINLDGRTIAQGINADNTYNLNVVLGHPGNTMAVSNFIVQQRLP